MDPKPLNFILCPGLAFMCHCCDYYIILKCFFFFILIIIPFIIRVHCNDSTTFLPCSAFSQVLPPCFHACAASCSSIRLCINFATNLWRYCIMNVASSLLINNPETAMKLPFSCATAGQRIYKQNMIILFCILIFNQLFFFICELHKYFLSYMFIKSSDVFYA